MVKPHCSYFRIITAIFSGVRSFFQIYGRPSLKEGGKMVFSPAKLRPEIRQLLSLSCKLSTPDHTLRDLPQKRRLRPEPCSCSYLRLELPRNIIHIYKLSHVMRKPVYAICEQQRLRSAWASAQYDQHLCFRCIYSLISEVSTAELSSL